MVEKKSTIPKREPGYSSLRTASSLVPGEWADVFPVGRERNRFAVQVLSVDDTSQTGHQRVLAERENLSGEKHVVSLGGGTAVRRFWE